MLDFALSCNSAEYSYPDVAFSSLVNDMNILWFITK